MLRCATGLNQYLNEPEKQLAQNKSKKTQSTRIGEVEVTES